MKEICTMQNFLPVLKKFLKYHSILYINSSWVHMLLVRLPTNSTILFNLKLDLLFGTGVAISGDRMIMLSALVILSSFVASHSYSIQLLKIHFLFDDNKNSNGVIHPHSTISFD